MKILFDFALFGDPHVDAQLLDIMLAVKTEINHLLLDHAAPISADAGLVVVTIVPKKLSLKYFFAGDEETSSEVQRLLTTFDWQEVVERHLQAAMN